MVENRLDLILVLGCILRLVSLVKLCPALENVLSVLEQNIYSSAVGLNGLWMF